MGLRVDAHLSPDTVCGRMRAAALSAALDDLRSYTVHASMSLILQETGPSWVMDKDLAYLENLITTGQYPEIRPFFKAKARRKPIKIARTLVAVVMPNVHWSRQAPLNDFLFKRRATTVHGFAARLRVPN